MQVRYTAFERIVDALHGELHAAFDEVLKSGRYILGNNLVEFEKTMANFLGVRHVIGVSSGTCALHLAMRQLGIKPGDEVVTAPNSFLASASTIALVGATPRFADVGADMNMDPVALESAITKRTKGIIPVHLTGRPCRMPEILKIARKHKLFVLEDCAQAVGAKLNGKCVGSFGDAAAFSCHPLKNLFSYGDSGMIATSKTPLFKRLYMARSHGMPDRDTCAFWSYNARMDELQAALLRVHFKHLHSWTEERRRLARRYNEALQNVTDVPWENKGEYHVYQTYMIQCDRRDELQQYLRDQGVEALTHYRRSIHLQPAAKNLEYRKGSFPMAEKLAQRILSLPLYPYMTNHEQDYVVEKIKTFYRK